LIEVDARLTDFGLSKEGIYNNLTKSFCGSIAYLSPEVLLKRGHSRTVDWYLVGVLLYELIVGIPPYYNQVKLTIYIRTENNYSKT
jgi:serine/threonine protein kinase